jgi:hypothetical protein
VPTRAAAAPHLDNAGCGALLIAADRELVTTQSVLLGAPSR